MPACVCGICVAGSGYMYTFVSSVRARARVCRLHVLLSPPLI